MKLEIAQFTCAKCASKFEGPEIGGGGAYGEFLLRSSTGQMAYLNAIEDQAYEEVNQLLIDHPKTAHISPLSRAKILQQIFGLVACDKALDESVLVLGAHPPCPVCGNQDVASWMFKDPSEFVDIAVAPVTHTVWGKLSTNEKQLRVEMALRDR